MPKRTRQTRTIRGLVVEIEPLSPRLAFRILARLIRTVGAPAAAGLSDPEKLRQLVGGELSLTHVGLWFAVNVLPGLGEHSDAPGLDDDELGKIAETVLVGHTTINGTAIASPEILDVAVGDVYDYLRVMRFALEVNFRPIGAGGVTGDGSAPPAADPPATTGRP